MLKRSKLFLFVVFGCVLFGGLASATIPSWNSAAGQTYNLSEDSLFTYNFSANVTNPETNMTFSFFSINNYDSQTYNLNLLFPWIGINSTTGIMAINATNNNQTGLFNISTDVTGASGGTHAIFYFNVTPVNDAPYFSNLLNYTFNATELFAKTLIGTDEENNIPFTFNVSFLSCSSANWSTRLSTNCNLFNVSNLSQYSVNSTNIFLNFTPTKDDVGSYIINFTVTDLNNLVKPYNASASKFVNFTVFDKNTAPTFTDICDGKINVTENTSFSCYINVTDLGEEKNITFSSNSTYTNQGVVSYPSWFVNNLSLVNKTTAYKGYALVSFTPTDLDVGNWTINISATDSGYPGINILSNSTVLNFSVFNVNDSVSLGTITDREDYNTSGVVTFYINASDDDLLIPDKTVYNESLTFSLNESGWISVVKNNTIGNTTIARVQYDSSAAGNTAHYINTTVRDANNFSVSSKIFLINISNNAPPAWANTVTSYSLTEGSNFILNLSSNVSDANGDTVTFWYANDTSFPSFSLNSTTKVINFTSVEEDVGYHNVTIYANDSKTSTPLVFNFTINNVNDAPNITSIYGTGLSVGAGYNMNISEGNITNIYVNVTDEDLRILQKNFYNENLTLNLTIQGPNPDLFSFIKANYNLSSPDLNIFGTTFTPVLSDVGNYSAVINITDVLGLSSYVKFNMTVFKVKQNPTLSAVQNLNYVVGNNLYLRLNATDRDDGNSGIGDGNFTFAYSNISGNNIFNSTTFNTATGEFNITLSQGDAGSHQFNVSVNNSANLADSKIFWVYVYDAPNITFNSSTEFDLKENVTSNLTFRANHAVADNLTYLFYINNGLRYNVSYYGNNTNLTWGFTPNFTDETYSIENLTLVVLNPLFNNLNVTKTWNTNITHTNSSVLFNGTIPDVQSTYDQTVSVDLKNYFSNPDYFDMRYNYSTGFSLGRDGSDIGYSFNNATWMLTFNSGIVSDETFNVTMNNSFSSATSNNFEIVFSTPSTTSTPTSSPSGGSSGGTSVQYYALKVITPGDVNISQEGYIEIPFAIQNAGQVALQGIALSSQVTYNNLNTQDVRVVLANSSIDKLDIGTLKNMTMKVYTDVSKSGKYRVYIYANVSAPLFSDWGEFYIELGKANETEAGDSLAFTSKLISENPQCLELTELLKEAQKFLDNKDYNSAVAKSKEVVTACEKLISNEESLPPQRSEIKIVGNYAIIATVAILMLWGLFYLYKRARFNKPKLDDYIEVK